MGGDNILDNVNVTFSFSEGKKITVDGAKAQLAPVGGYIGVVVNGGVYFRNMARTNSSGTAITYGLTNDEIKGRVGTSGAYETNLVSNSTTKWLYVNPIIGRVINGFAVTESDAYRPFENGSRSRVYVKENAQAADPANTSNYSAIVTNEAHIKYNQRVTMQNGTKNYSITDISPDLEDLSFTNDTGETGNYNIKPKNAQSFFLMSCMVNSGMSSTGLGYYATNMMSRCAAYSNVGINTTTKADCPDYNNKAQNDAQSKEGYLIQQYADSTNAKTIGANATTIKLTKQDYILPDGYKGIGNFYQSAGSYVLKVSTFTGNGASISQNTSFNYYSRSFDDKTNVFTTKDSTDDKNGLGLFNYQGTSGTYKDFFLSGNVKTSLINNSSGDVFDYTLANYGKVNEKNKGWHLSVGMLMGCANASMMINSVALENVEVIGGKYTGGLIGNIPNSNTTIKNESSYDSNNITVKSGVIAGGLIGRNQQGTLTIDYNNCTFNITSVICLKTSFEDDKTAYWNYAIGGLIGICRANDKAGKLIKIENIIVGNEDNTATVSAETADVYAGGLIGIVNRGYLSLSNCKAYNLSVKSKLSTGGIVGQWATSSGGSNHTSSAKSYITNTELYSTLKGDKQAEIKCTGTNAYSVAGGFIGAGKEDMFDVTISNSSIHDYKISANKYAGGVVGAWGDSSSTGGCTFNDHYLKLNNILASGCNIQAGTSSGCAGGVVGNLNWSKDNNHSDDHYNLYGYNIMTKNLSFAGKNRGYICGYNTKTAYNDIKLVGFSRQNNQTGTTMIASLIGADDTTDGDFDSYGTNGYVIFADYNGKSLNPTNNAQSSYIKTTVTYDENDSATSTPTDTDVWYNTFTENFLYSVTSDNVTSSSQNVSNQKTVTYRIPKINSTTGKVERNNKGEIIYEVKSYSYGDNWPNVTSSPSYYLNSTYSEIHAASGSTPAVDAQHFLTGDGVSSLYYSASAINNIPDSVAKSIIADIGNNETKAYLNTGLDADALTTLNTALSTDQKYSTFKKEMGSSANSIPRDFPVLVVDDVSAANTNAFINNYLRLLTNSSIDFSTNQSGVFSVRTAKCTYDSNDTHTFIPDYSTCNLKYNSGKGFSIGNSYDNEEKDGDTKLLVFSLIDVEFYDPSDPNSVAYHLYVPCVVKKLLRFTFEATTLSGSSYKISPEYTSNRKNTLLENFENPVTLEFRYTYERSLKDWREAILSGENVLFSFSKDILLVSATEDPVSHVKDTPGPMKMILVDSNKYSDGTTQNIAYYADNTADGQSCIVRADDNTNYRLQLTGFATESGTAYVPKLVNDFLIVTADKVNGTGNFTSTTAEDATVRAICEEETDPVYLKPSENNDGDYQISENAEDHSVVYADGRNTETAQLYEDYYITFLTERPDKTNDLYKYNAVTATDGAYVLSSEGAEGAFQARSSENYIWLKAKGKNETGTYNIEKLFHYSFESMRQLSAKAPDGVTSRSYPTQSYQSQESHLYVGDLYNNSITVKTYHTSETPSWQGEYHDQIEEISMTLPELYVDLTAKVSLTKTAKGALGTTVQENSKIDVYQSLLYTFNWKKLESDSTTPTSKLGILSASDLNMISYTVAGSKITNGDVTDKYSKSDLETRALYLDTSNKNYVELKNLIDIAESLSNEVTIDAKFKLSYGEKRDVTTQFAERKDDSDESGTSVIGYSNISSSRDETANSAMSTTKEGGSKYYSSEDNMASLQYDAVGKNADDFGEFGINANDLSETEQADGKAKVETIAYYSLDSWSSIREPKKIRLEFEMFDKYGGLINGTRTPYSKNLKISDYLADFKVYTSRDSNLDGTESACTVVQSDMKYTYTIDLTEAGYQLLDYNDGLDSYTFYVDYNVLTGKKSSSNAWFENLTRMYQNYMVKLTVSLIDIDDDGKEYVMTGSNPSDHIIYTNARINPDIVDTANP